MARLPLQTLPAFRAVARRANLRAAADELHLTHSAVSQQIRLLEQQLGFELFDRHGRRIALNAAGAALLQATEAALTELDLGVQRAASAADGREQHLRVSVLPSFAQRWLLPRMTRWHERHPGITIEWHASLRAVDLAREGFHAALRQGGGQWPGLTAERLVDSPVIAVAAPSLAASLKGRGEAALLDQALIGDAELWHQWFAAAGIRSRVRPVATFNDSGLLLQAAEKGLGLALARELFAADALAEGRLVRLSPVAIEAEGRDAYYLVHPPALADWPPIVQLKRWLADEIALAQRQSATLRQPRRRSRR